MFCLLLLSFGPISIFNWSSCTPQKKKKVANIEPSRAGTTCQRSFDSVGKKSLSYWVNRFRSSQTHQLRLDVTLISQIICFKKKCNCCSNSLKFNHMWYEIFHICYKVLLKFIIFKLVKWWVTRNIKLFINIIWYHLNLQFSNSQTWWVTRNINYHLSRPKFMDLSAVFPVTTLFFPTPTNRI